MGIKKKHVPGCTCCGVVLPCDIEIQPVGGGFGKIEFPLSGWTVQSGSWANYDDGLGIAGVTTSSTTALVTRDDPHPDGVAPFFASALLHPTGTNYAAKMRVICGYQDSSNFVYALRECLTEGAGYFYELALVSVASGTASELGRISLKGLLSSAWQQFANGDTYLCWNGTVLTASAYASNSFGGGAGAIKRVSATMTPPGSYFGVGTDDVASEIIWRGFYFGREASVNAECEECVEA